MKIAEFVQKLMTDKAFAEKYHTLGHDIPALLAQAKQDGFTIDKTEIEAALSKVDLSSIVEGKELSGLLGSLGSLSNLFGK